VSEHDHYLSVEKIGEAAVKAADLAKRQPNNNRAPS
jgi:hypothetical protein